MRSGLISIGFCLFILLVFIQGAGAALPAWVKNAQSEVKVTQFESISSMPDKPSSNCVDGIFLSSIPQEDSASIARTEEFVSNIQLFKNHLDTSEEKIEGTLLNLYDSKYPGFNADSVNLLTKSLKNDGLIKSSNIHQSNEEDLIMVNVILDDFVSTHIVDSFMDEIDTRHEEQHIVGGWISLKNLQSLSEIIGVKNIKINEMAIHG